MKHAQEIVTFSFILVLLVGIGSCVVEPPTVDDGSLEFIVTGTDGPLEGALIEVGRQRAHTDVLGRASLSLAPGDHEYSVSAPDYQTRTGTRSVVAGGTTRVSITLDATATPGCQSNADCASGSVCNAQGVCEPTPTSGTLEVTVTDDRASVSGATVAVGQQSVQTNTQGRASLTLPAGDYDYSVSSTNHNTRSGSVLIMSGEVTSLDVQITWTGGCRENADCAQGSVCVGGVCRASDEPPATKYTLTVRAIPEGGQGTVTVGSTTIHATQDVATEHIRFEENDQATLTAQATSGSVFFGWSGACQGQQEACTITMDGDKTVDAVFHHEQIPSPHCGSYHTHNFEAQEQEWPQQTHEQDLCEIGELDQWPQFPQLGSTTTWTCNTAQESITCQATRADLTPTAYHLETRIRRCTVFSCSTQTSEFEGSLLPGARTSHQGTYTVWPSANPSCGIRVEVRNDGGEIRCRQEYTWGDACNKFEFFCTQFRPPPPPP